MTIEKKKTATQKKKMATEKKHTTKKRIELDERDLERATGGATAGVVEDPCAGGRSRAR